METSTLLDHVYATVFDHVNEIIVPKIGLSDHYPTVICYKRPAVKVKKFGHLSINYRDIDSLDIVIFSSQLYNKLSHLKFYW